MNISQILSTLFINGFEIDKVDRFSEKNIIINIYKNDKLGAEIRYSILFTEDNESLINSLLTISQAYNSTPILISDTIKSEKLFCYKIDEFFNFFGGLVNTGLILIPNLPDVLHSLGTYKLPNILSGEPDDLHELYVKECLQFLLESPGRRYGKERLFESLPDNVILSKEKFMILIDSKSYSNGFKFCSDDIKRFASYVKDFNERYSAFFGNVLTFLVVSAIFLDSEDSMARRSDELYKECNCKLSSLSSSELGRIVNRIQAFPDLRKSIQWKNIFSKLIITETLINKEIKRILKDNLH